jgi:hypothetical protein
VDRIWLAQSVYMLSMESKIAGLIACGVNITVRTLRGLVVVLTTCEMAGKC